MYTGVVLVVMAASIGSSMIMNCCVDKQEAVNNSYLLPHCLPFIPTSSVLLFQPEEMYRVLVANLEVFAVARLSTHYCDQVFRTYVCNYFYPPCESDGIVPIGICNEECVKFVLMDNPCAMELKLLVNVEYNVPFLRQCNDTLEVVQRLVDVNVSMSCINISEIVLNMETEETFAIISTDVVSLRMSLSQQSVIISVIVSFIILIAIATAVGLIMWQWVRVKRLKSARNISYSTTQPSNDYQPYYLKAHNSNLEKQSPVFKLDVEDVMKNPKLKQSVVPFQSLVMEEEIGHGAFGSVYRGKYYPTQESEPDHCWTDVAVKTIASSSASYSELKGFLEESVIMCGFDHPHVLGLIGICLDPSNSPLLLLPFMENGDLRTYLKNKRHNMKNSEPYPEGLNYKVLFRMCVEIAEGMQYIASKKLVHRDLAARNCVLDDSLSVRVADFGLTRDIYETDYYRQSQQGRVPVKWMAPESLHDRVSNEQTDVWSYGVTCWEIFSLGRSPYPSVSNADVIEYLEKGRRLKKPDLCSEVLYKLLRSCWVLEAKNRPDFSQLCVALQTLASENKSITLPPADVSTSQTEEVGSKHSEYLQLISPTK